jgi:prolyl-tRNA synthetase
MRMSRLMSHTLREAPSDAEITSHKLLVRAGFIRQLGAGVYSLLPLGYRTHLKIENILRKEIDAIGGQEISMPVVNPAEVWKETNRFYEIGSEMTRFQDRKGADMVLAMTHEEIMADLGRKFIQSYKQLPILAYHIQTKWRDDARPRAGLIRVREFKMKDSYSLDKDEDGLNTQYKAHYQAYFNIFNRAKLPSVAVLSDVGMMGGSMAHEYMYLTPIGEDTLLICDTNNDYLANRQIALFKKPEGVSEELLPMEKVGTPNTKTIEDLALFLNIPKSKTAKAIFMMATITEGDKDIEKMVFAVVRGDMELNETKLTNAVKAKELRPATEEEILEIGAEPGYGSPIGVKDALIVVDDSIKTSTNLVAGANEEGFHYLNVNLGRDFQANIVTDIVAAKAGDLCINCGNPLIESRGVEIGNIFKLGTKYTKALNVKFLDENGKAQHVIMGSYGIGVGRMMACVAEEHNDEHGLKWPISVSPYDIHIVALKGGEEKAEELFGLLKDAGLEVLFDDRKESPGVKFKDADLIGLPMRITVSKKSLVENSVEFKLRDESDRNIVLFDDIVKLVLSTREKMFAEIEEGIVEVQFPL